MIVRLKARLKSILPSGLVSFVNDLRNISPEARWTYLRLRASRTLRVRKDTASRLRARIGSILVVCHGNIIRSPMAAALLRRYLAEAHCTSISVSSAGTGAKPGVGADARAGEVSQGFGVSLEGHQAQPLTASLVEGNDLILVMDYRNEAEVLCRYPEAASKVFMLNALSGQIQSQSAEIPDPYSGTMADVRQCFETLRSCTQRLVLALSYLPSALMRGRNFRNETH